MYLSFMLTKPKLNYTYC